MWKNNYHFIWNCQILFLLLYHLTTKQLISCFIPIEGQMLYRWAEVGLDGNYHIYMSIELTIT